MHCEPFQRCVWVPSRKNKVLYCLRFHTRRKQEFNFEKFNGSELLVMSEGADTTNGFRRRVLLIISLWCVLTGICNLNCVNAFSETDYNEIDTKSNDAAVNRAKLTEIKGGEIVGERILRSTESPFVAMQSIEIARGGNLTIEPGVTIQFGPTIGITVRGILHAVGTPTNRIILTSQNVLPHSRKELPAPEEVGARLVDGPTPLEGRLQIFHKGAWRSVCTNSRNWTVEDYETTCRQIGFKGGKFWNWMERSAGFHPRLLYEEPRCLGSEPSLFDCAWHTRQLGSGVCDYHSDIGIQCWPLHSTPMGNWRGLKFEAAPSIKFLGLDNTVYSAVSQSILKYVDIIRAGSGPGMSANSAIEVLGLPPVLQEVVVNHSAFNGVNVTRPDGGFTIRNITVRKSNGHGVFVNSSYGSVLLEGCNIMNNAADGIKYVGHDLRSNERSDRASIHDFCTLPTTSGQTYPISLSLYQKFYAGASKECGKYFFTKPGYVLTVHFEYFTVQFNESASLEIFDGSSVNDRLLASWNVRNHTRLQAVTSTREKLFIRFKVNVRTELLGFLRITTGPTRTFDLKVADSMIEDNRGRGIAVDNVRSKVHIDGCSVSGNGHVSGIHVTSGAGDINITNSKISFNQGDGVNITYFGGNRNVSRSSIGSNKGCGVAVWLNLTSDIDRLEFLPLNQTTVVEYSQIFKNLETAILHGNYCAPLWVNITGNSFNFNNLNDVHVHSCWFQKTPGAAIKPTEISRTSDNLHLQIGHNLFEQSQKNSIVISPALNLKGRIEFNQFRYGSHGGIYIRNVPQLEEFNLMPVNLIIQYNYFMRNKGVYVVSLGLSPYSRKEVQSLLFTRNFVRENKISEPFGPLTEGSEGAEGSGRLNPRSRIAAPVIVSSSNVDIFRNIISNHDSKYEIGSQLCDQSQIINATFNWLGHADESKIYPRLFHRNDRFNLAKIQYLPYLLHNSNPGSTTIISVSTFVSKFFSEEMGIIGGEVDGQEMIPAGTYTVSRDINIRPGGKLILQPGVTLRFEPSVGMMVAGKLEARGKRPDDIFFTLKRETVIASNDTSDVTEINSEVNMDVIDIKTETIFDKEGESSPTVPVRLLGGAGEYEGRLQLYLDGRWGTVCDYGWSLTNAALACQQLGYTLNPLDWRLHRSQIPGVGIAEDVIASNIQCTEHDTDITKCRSERVARGEFENSCTHENDVGIRCYEGAWAGIRFSMLADRADLQYVTVEKAGLFDYATNAFKPAVQIDFARHNLENVRVVENLDDGLGIIYSDVFGGKSINNVKNSEFTKNRGNGISLKQLGLRIHGSIVRDNHGSGISHDPVVSDMDQKELSGWFKMSPDFNTFDSDYEPFLLPKETASNVDLDTRQTKYIITEEVAGQPLTRKIFVRCQPGYVLGIQLLNPIQNRSTEDIFILDSQTDNSRSSEWNVKRDLNVFPVTSSSYGVIIYYNSGVRAAGGTVLLFSTVAAPVQDVRNRVVRGPIPSLIIRSTKILKNYRGISAFYYNRYVGENAEIYLRKANESITVINSEISYNAQEAILIKSPYWDVHISNISEITIHINSTMIMQNGYGIRHFSKDLRSSNNLFHYAIQDTTIEDNANGGFEVTLPYVWQYNENFTHSVFFGNSTWQRNRNFQVAVDGHFTVVNISSNVFLNNYCSKGLIALSGMEKQIRFNYNRIENNNAKFIMEFRADSLSEIIGEMPALVDYNIIKNNRYDTMVDQRSLLVHQLQRPGTRTPTAVIRFNGIQKVALYRNLIAENGMDYDMVAGVRSARLNNFLYASENWWGSLEVKFITSRIFDFDNWNDHADVIFEPYLIEDSFDASVSLVSEKREDIEIENIGGRIYKDLKIKKRQEPYRVLSDITVMPGVTLTIQHGVQMEFDANVGILVLGTLNAIGYKESQIVMRPLRNHSHEGYTVLNKRSSPDNNFQIRKPVTSYDFVRLCKRLNCTSIVDGDVLGKAAEINEGFLEYFNHTTLQWVPICDHRFTERNAQVVCRELGFDPLNVYYSHDRRIEFHTNSLTRIWSWVQPLECRGDELRMEECAERLNGQLYGHRHECHWYDTFVFVSCGSGSGSTDENTFWGGIRFANSEFEQNLYEHRLHDIHTHSLLHTKQSRLEFVRIENAGILHNEKSPAVQSIFKSPSISSVTIVNSAQHGVNLISPGGIVNLKFLNISKALGNGINVLSLTGEGHESEESSFFPLKDLDLPYNLFSMVDICDPQKVLTVEERILVYYKYDNNPVNCVKIFSAAYRAKPLGFRLLQSNLFNHSKLYGRTDVIRLYDGDIYNLTSKYMGKIESDSHNQNSFFKTLGYTLSIQLIASGAPERHGFIAEVVTVPISTIGHNRDARHNLTTSHISETAKGAVAYLSVGEVSPTLTLTSNQIRNNCRQLYGNFSTCESAVHVDVQNMQSFYFMNNLLQHNQGGLRIRADSRGSATSLRGFIHHNLFLKNVNRPALYVEGRQSSPYQEVELFRNYFAQNNAGFEDVIRMKQVVSNFSYNYVHSNIGGRIVEVSGFDRVRLPIYQTTAHNGFYRNIATSWNGRTTIVAGTAGQQYVDNVFENPDNDYEMITVNNSNLNIEYWNSTVELWRSKIDARHNYWSYNSTLSVESRIRDKSDDPRLLQVQAVPFRMNNKTILDGKCPPGWSLVHDTCFIYVGAPMTFNNARDFCRSENSSMPFIRTDSVTLWAYLQGQMQHLRYPERVWIQDFNYIDKCSSFIFGEIEIEDCNSELGFICEVDPKVVIDPLSWRADVFAVSIISAFVLAVILLIMVAFCWYAKSKHRHVQRLQRRNSIRQSLRSLNSIDPQGSLRRRNLNMSSSNTTLTKNTAQDYKKMMSNSSIDSMEKSVLSSEASFDAYEGHATTQNEYQSPQGYSEYASDSGLKLMFAGLPNDTNRVATIRAASKGPSNRSKEVAADLQRPYGQQNHANAFELSYRNEGFRDNSTFSGTGNNSVSTSIAEDAPIIHQTDTEDVGSDYYGNASTLPLRSGANDSLSFLSELKQCLPEYDSVKEKSHSSFLLAAPPVVPSQLPTNSPLFNQSYSSSTLPYDQKIDNFNFTPLSEAADQIQSIVRNANAAPFADIRRPDSYYTAVQSSIVQRQPQTTIPSRETNNRPKTVYQTADDHHLRKSSHARSKSEVLLETDFDEENPNIVPLQLNCRSYSQPLETAM